MRSSVRILPLIQNGESLAAKTKRVGTYGLQARKPRLEGGEDVKLSPPFKTPISVRRTCTLCVEKVEDRHFKPVEEPTPVEFKLILDGVLQVWKPNHETPIQESLAATNVGRVDLFSIRI